MKSKTAQNHDWPNDNHSHLDVRRLYSYIYQLDLAMASLPQKILYVGKGSGIAPYLLARCPGDPEVITMDIEEKFEPDLVGSVLDIPLEDNAVNVTLCCQVLEHLPFAKFAPALREMHRVTRDRLILSLPNKQLYFAMYIKVPLIKLFGSFSLTRFPLMFLPYPEKKFKINGHYWEIGYKGTSMHTIKNTIRESGWKIAKIKRVPDWSWHTFFELYSERLT